MPFSCIRLDIERTGGRDGSSGAYYLKYENRLFGAHRMPKGQQRSNRETKKPKQRKAPPAPPPPFSPPPADRK